MVPTFELMGNILETGENAGHPHFLLPQCFQKPFFKVSAICDFVLKSKKNFNPFSNKSWFLCLQCNPFENTVGKGKIYPFSTELSTNLENFLPFSSNLKLSSANSFSLTGSKIFHLGKG